MRYPLPAIAMCAGLALLQSQPTPAEDSLTETEGNTQAEIVALGHTAAELDAILQDALDHPKEFKVDLKENCSRYHNILLTVAEAIQFGSRIFNAGKHGATYLHYHGTTYKVLYTLEGQCPRLEAALLASLARAEKESAYGSKAWRLREGLDLVMGPQLKPPGAR